MVDDLITRAIEIEARLNDCGALVVEASLASIRELHQSTPTPALVGAVVLAEAVLDDIERSRTPTERDGDVQVAYQTFAPGPQVGAFVEQIRQAEKAAEAERRRMILPLTNLIKRMAAHDERASV